MDQWQRLGAKSNADWCDLVVRAHGGQGVFADDAWTSPTRTPQLFPDAVTLTPRPPILDLLSRVDASSGCTIKDSFASLELATAGFSVLFDAQWIASPPYPDKAWSVPAGWTHITDPEGLGVWEAAWSHDEPPGGLLLPELVSEGIVVLGRIKNGQITAGGIVSRSSHVGGISNVFTEVGDASETWTALAQCARALFPEVPLIGYERGEDLIHARRGGFHSVGALRVWIANT